MLVRLWYHLVMKQLGDMCMKSTTIRRSNLSKEKMAVLEALKKYRNEESDYAPNVYIRPAEVQQGKKEELDLLWRNFKLQDIHTGEKTPRVYIATGIAAGLLLVGALTMTVFFAHSVHSDNVADSGAFGIIPASQTEETSAKNETYIVQNGDTIEKILIRFYGRYSKNSEISLMKANNMSNPNKLSIGQELIIPMN